LIETSCTILDLKGVGLAKATQVYGYLQETSKIGQNYYPERMGTFILIFYSFLGKFYLLNAPWGFATVWSVIKRWLDPVTVAKISILGGSYQAALLAQIPAENLPSQFGGTCKCVGGCELSDEGPWQHPEWLGGENVTEAKSEEPILDPPEPISVPVEAPEAEALPAAI
jgi:hypothetical protein